MVYLAKKWHLLTHQTIFLEFIRKYRIVSDRINSSVDVDVEELMNTLKMGFTGKTYLYNELLKFLIQTREMHKSMSLLLWQ